MTIDFCITLPVGDVDELATTFLDKHQLTKKDLQIVDYKGPENRKPASQNNNNKQVFYI